MIPAWLRLLERLLLRGEDREFLAGDLREDYRRHRRASGPVPAAGRYAIDLALATRRGCEGPLRRMLSDVRYAVRTLRRRPVFAAAASLTLAVGLGATTAIFAVADAVLLAPLPYPEAERLLFVSSSFPGATGGGDQLSYPDIRELAARSRSLEAIAAYHTSVALQLRGGAGTPERVRANIVGAEYLGLLGARAARGRLFNADDDRIPNGHPVVVVSHAFWVKRLASDPGVIGRTLVLSDRSLTVIGVLDASFRDVSAEEGYRFDSDVFIPAMMIPSFGAATLLTERGAKNWWALARVKRGVPVEAAIADIASIGEQLQQEWTATNRGFTFWGARLESHLARDIRQPLLLLLAGSGFVLLIACANVANLILARVSSRRRELAVRRALGARPSQILSLVFAECIVLASVGGGTGMLIASVGDDLFRQLVPGELTPRLAAAGMNAKVVLFGVGLTTAVALALGTLSALRLTRGLAAAGLRDGARGATEAGGGRLRKLLLTAEVATAVLLVIGALLMVGSLKQLRGSGFGFRTERLITLEMDLRTERYAASDAVVRFGRELVKDLGAVPGVEAALLWGPARPGRNTWVLFPSREEAPVTAERIMTWRHTVNPGALADLGIPLLRGRDFTDQDTLMSPRVIIVSETLARSLWPGEDVLGKRMRSRADRTDSPLFTIIGVAADAKHRGRLNDLRHPARDVYLPHAQRAERMIVAVVRASGDPASITGGIRAAVRRLDPELPLFNIATMAEHLAEEEAETRFAAVLMTTFGVLALVLAAIGIYGVLSYHVTLRSREVAVRMALGAAHGDVVRMVLADGLRPALAGIAIGLTGAMLLTRYLASLLFGVAPRDPVTFAAVAVILLLVALAAAWLPARHATLVQPIEALRAE